MAKLLRAMLFVALCGLLWACTPSTTEREGLAPLQVVPRVEIEKYMGVWYEIAGFPQWFQKGCTGTTAAYSLRDDGEVDVVNRCFLESLAGEEKVARGRARVTDPATNAKLEVSFFGPFWGEYWILELAADYSYAVVGHPGRDSLWILSRTAQMDPSTFDDIVARLVAVHHYDVSRIRKTLQPVQ